jgi:hypothetical protein
MKKEYQVYLTQDKEELNKVLLDCCYGSYNFDLVQFLLTSPLIQEQQRPDVNESKAFSYACHCGYTDIAIWMLTHPTINPKPDIHQDKDFSFRSICEYGFNDLFDFFLFSEKMHQTPDIHTWDDYAFRFSASAGHTYIAQTLLTSEKLNTHPDIEANNNQAFRDTCQSHQLDMVQFLAQSPLLKKHADIVSGIVPACKNRNGIDILDYLYTFDSVRHFLAQHPDQCLYAVFEKNYENVPLANFRWLMDKPEIFYNLSHHMSIENDSFFTHLARSERDDIKISLFMEYGYRLNDEQLQWLHDRRKNKSVKQSLNIYKRIQLHDKFLTDNSPQLFEQSSQSLKI